MATHRAVLAIVLALAVFGQTTRALSLSEVYAAIANCQGSQLTDNVVNCDNAEGYVNCLNAITGADDEGKAKVGDKVKFATGVLNDCAAMAKVSNCNEQNLVGGQVTCAGMVGIVDCLNGIDVSASANAEANKNQLMSHYIQGANQCQAFDQLKNCGDTHAPGGKISCDDLPGYIDCMNKVDVSKFPKVQAQKDTTLQQLNGYVEQCGGNNAVSGAQQKLDKCMSDHLPSGTLNCENVGPYLDCLKAADVSDVAEVQARKDANINTYGSLQRKCQAIDKKQKCLSDVAADGVIKCSTVKSYLACLRALDVSEFADLVTAVQASISKYEKYYGECAANAAIEFCSTKHAPGGSVTCDTIGPYLECVKAVNTEGYEKVKAHQDSTLSAFAPFKAQCEGNSGSSSGVGAASPTGDKKRDCIQAHAPNRRLNCKNSPLLLACYQAIPAAAPLVVSQKVDKCNAQVPLDQCIKTHAPTRTISCTSGQKLLDCFKAANVDPAAQKLKDYYVGHISGLLNGSC